MTSTQLRNFQVQFPAPDVCFVWIDVEGRSMNVFTGSVMEELERIVRRLESEQPAVVVFISSKPTGFFAGADVHEIQQLSDAGVQQVLQQGQNLFARIENLSSHTVAAIRGPCLGGGLEFALACRHRIVCEDSLTRLGLPEIQLGLIPGWGGTQRLPKLIGLTKSLPMILQGKKVSASAAVQIGLADRLLPAEGWPEAVLANVPTLPESRSNSLRSLAAGLSQWWPFRKIIERSARAAIRSNQSHYPALQSAIRAVFAGVDARRNGFVTEQTEFRRLLQTSACRNLLNLFLWRERARTVSASANEPSTTDGTTNTVPVSSVTSPCATVEFRPQTAGVVGAGAMGAGIGLLLAVRGFDVVVRELNSALAQAAQKKIEQLLQKMVGRNRLSREEADRAASRLTYETELTALKECDVVIEAVVEQLDVKKSLFAELESVVSPEAILVSNTSALSIGDMSAPLLYPERVAGLHFFNPVHRMELVEVVRSRSTSEATLATLCKLVKTLGKTPIVTADRPGFLVNRVLFPYLSEAIHLVLEGVDAAEIDQQAKQFGMPMGPLELLDHVGLDVALHVTDRLETVLPQASDVKALLQKMVEHDRLGQKSSGGFYDYQQARRGGVCQQLPVFVAEVGRSAGSAGDDRSVVTNVGRFVDDGLTDIQRRLVYSMVNEAGFCLQEDVVSEPWMADLAMVLGTGFAPFRGGPLSFADSLRTSTLLNNFAVLAARYGERFKASAWLMNHVRRSQPATRSNGRGSARPPGTTLTPT